MKTSELLKKSVYSATAFFATLCVLSVGYGAYSALSNVNVGDPLSKDAWNQMVGNLEDLNARWSRSGGNIAYTGGNVGIGTASPGQKLTVAGTIESTSGGVKFPDGTTQGSAAGAMANIAFSATTGSPSSFSFNITDGTYPFGTTSSATDLFTFNKAGTYQVYAWAESGFTSWQPVINGGLPLTHNYASAEDVMAIYYVSAVNGTTFKWNFTTNHSNPLTGYVWKIVRLGD
jgi:hypothetical protein